MRKLIWPAVVAAALAAAGTAVAHRVADKGVTVVPTTFTASPSGATRTRTCTDAANHVWQITNAVYRGTATGALSGNVTIKTQSIVDTTSGDGFTDGTMALRDASNKAIGTVTLNAVNSQSSALDGLLQGRVSGGRLIANFTANVASDGTLSGAFGSGTGSNSAVVFGGLPKCTPQHVAPPKPVLRFDGRVAATPTSTSLSVKDEKKTYTLTVPSSLASAVTSLHVGDRVAITAAYINGAYTLVALHLEH